MKAAILSSGAADGVEPPALVPVAGAPVLRRAIAALGRVGVDELVIAGDARVRAAVTAWDTGAEVAFVDSASITAMRPHLDGEPFLLLDDVLVFDAAVLDVLLERGLDTLAVRAVIARKGALRVAVDREDHVTELGRDLPVRTIGEVLGVALLSGDSSSRMFAAIDDAPGYEPALAAVIAAGAPMLAVDIGARLAFRIETYADLCRANARMPALDLGGDVRLSV